jgi:uncharacterized membrane protein
MREPDVSGGNRAAILGSERVAARDRDDRWEVVVDWLQFVVQWLHVIGAITWFGAVIYADFILIPALTSLPIEIQRAAGGAIGLRASKVIPGAAMGVIVLGILRGTVWGPIKSTDILTSTYGLTWLVALILAIATFAFAKRVLEPAIMRLNSLPPTAPDGTANPALTTAVDAIKRATLVELGLFLVIFTCMILMRFGY